MLIGFDSVGRPSTIVYSCDVNVVARQRVAFRHPVLAVVPRNSDDKHVRDERGSPVDDPHRCLTDHSALFPVVHFCRVHLGDAVMHPGTAFNEVAAEHDRDVAGLASGPPRLLEPVGQRAERVEHHVNRSLFPDLPVRRRPDLSTSAAVGLLNSFPASQVGD